MVTLIMTSCTTTPTHHRKVHQIYGLTRIVCLTLTILLASNREIASSFTLIDHVATNDKSNIVISRVYTLGLSDHYLVYCIRKFRDS